MHNERETWLVSASLLIQSEVFEAAGIPVLEAKHRVSCGFPIGYRGSRGNRKGIVLGQAFDPSISADGTYEVFINPILDQPLDVLGVLVHELLHVHAGIKCGHRGEFARAARAVGLTGPLTATVPGEALKAQLEAIASILGNYPHASVDPNARKKQATRLLKLECVECQWTARISAKQGLRIRQDAECPCCGEQRSLKVEYPSTGEE